MTIAAEDKNTLRLLAGKYAEIANLDIQQERLERYSRSNDLECVRPVVLIAEIPWGEIRDEALTNVCAPELHWLEGQLRRALYQWEHFQADMVVPPVFRIGKRIKSTGIGLRVKERQLRGEDTGSSITSHEYSDQLQSDDDLKKLRTPEISYNREATEANLETAAAVFDGLLKVDLCGHAMSYNIWDVIARYRGVDSLLMDLVMRPEFMHHTAQRFTEIAAAKFRQMEEQGLLDSEQFYVHCTPGCTKDLPATDYTGGAFRPRDVWGRCAAQIFGSVSPAMHDEFDLAYNEKLFGNCGLLYYGCCEPMDQKVDILRKRFSNLRKISITPWADAERAARNIGSDYVLAAKPNPALVAGTTFNKEAVEEEISVYCRSCRENQTPLEFVLKDISTIGNQPDRLTQWASTVANVLDQYYG